jgi:flagellar biosynthesis protein FlhA
VEAAREESDPHQLVEKVRQKIGALIVQTVVPVRMPLPVITLDASLESLLTQAVRTAAGAQHPIEPGLGQKIVSAVGAMAAPLMGEGRRFALVTSPMARRALSRLLAPHLPDVPVLSFLEIPDGKAVEVIAIVGGETPRTLIDTEMHA